MTSLPLTLDDVFEGAPICFRGEGESAMQQSAVQCTEQSGSQQPAAAAVTAVRRWQGKPDRESECQAVPCRVSEQASECHAMPCRASERACECHAVPCALVQVSAIHSSRLDHGWSLGPPQPQRHAPTVQRSGESRLTSCKAPPAAAEAAAVVGRGAEMEEREE